MLAGRALSMGSPCEPLSASYGEVCEFWRQSRHMAADDVASRAARIQAHFRRRQSTISASGDAVHQLLMDLKDVREVPLAT